MSDVLVPEEPQSAPPDGPDAGSVRRRRVAPFVALAVAVAIGALFVVLAGSKTGGNEAVSSFLIDKPAPTSTGTTLDGKPFDLSRRKGSWVVLNFFDPDCIPCQHEHPELVRLVDQQAQVQARSGDGAELYTIINRGSDDAVRAFFTSHGGDWPVVSDPTGAISTAFGVAQVPETWVVDPNGIVRARYAGEITADGVGALLEQLRERGR